MTDEAKALVERLRDDLPQTLIEKHWVDDHDAIYKQREEAADLIETQAREIERLREALLRIAGDGYGLQGLIEDGAVTAENLADYWYSELTYRRRIARAALAGDSHDQ